jgi:hypothetical protein
MSTSTMPAGLPAKSWPPMRAPRPFGGQEPPQFEWVMPAFRSSPNFARGGGQELASFQMVMPAPHIPRLTTCVRLGGHTSTSNNKEPSQKERCVGGCTNHHRSREASYDDELESL